MVVVKEEGIVIICILNHYLNLLKEIFLHKCIYNFLNIERKKLILIVVVIIIGKKPRIKIENKKNINQRKTDLVQDKKSKRNRKRRRERDHHLNHQKILRK